MEGRMAQNTLQVGNLGFFTVQREPTGYVGGFLVTNRWGRLWNSGSAVPCYPTRFNRSFTAQRWSLTFSAISSGRSCSKRPRHRCSSRSRISCPRLDLRLHVALPIALVRNEGPRDADKEPGLVVTEASAVGNPPFIWCHAQFAGDVAILRELLEQLGGFDLADPFARIREALAEARKLGVSSCAA